MSEKETEFYWRCMDLLERATELNAESRKLHRYIVLVWVVGIALGAAVTHWLIL